MATKKFEERPGGHSAWAGFPWAHGRLTIGGVALVLALSGLAESGCASAQAKAKANERPALDVPPPPARVIEPAAEPDLEPVNELPVTPPVTLEPRPGRTGSRESAPKPEAPKPAEPKAGEQPATEPVPPVPPPPSTPPAQLKTPQTADSNNAARTVRATIDRANGLLNGVNYGPLSNERKKAYDDAKRFIQQAEEALKQGNFVFAQGVATKAETLARELSGK